MRFFKWIRNRYTTKKKQQQQQQQQDAHCDHEKSENGNRRDSKHSNHPLQQQQSVNYENRQSKPSLLSVPESESISNAGRNVDNLASQQQQPSLISNQEKLSENLNRQQSFNRFNQSINSNKRSMKKSSSKKSSRKSKRFDDPDEYYEQEDEESDDNYDDNDDDDDDDDEHQFRMSIKQQQQQQRQRRSNKSNFWSRSKSLKNIQQQQERLQPGNKQSTSIMSSSIRSLQRIGSFRGRFISSKNKLNKRNEYDDDNDDDDDDIDHDDDNDDDIDPIVGRKSTFCRYTEIYRRIILNDNLDLLVRPKNQHPKIIKNSRKRSNETTFVTKNCSGCNEMGSVLIIGSINDLLFHNLIGYLKNSNERLEKLTIQLDGTNIIDDSLRSFELFSKSVGNNIRSIRLVADYKDLSTAFMFNNSISTTLLQMLYLNNGCFTNLVEFEVLLSDNAILHYFEKFWCEFGNTIQRLTIKIRHDLHKFNEFALNILKLLLPPERLNDNDEENRERIRSIHFELIPISNQAITNIKIDLNQVLHAIGCLSRVFRTVITNVNLVVDINFVRQPLHLIECLAEFKLAETFQLTIHDKPNRLHFSTAKNRSTMATKLQLNFEKLATMKNLHHFYIDYSGLNNDDIEKLSRHCFKLQSLYIGCDNRIDKKAIYSIGKYLGRLQTLSIAPAFNHEYERDGLNINNDALIQLFTHIQMGSPIELSYGLALLRTLRLVNCRIRIDKIQHQVSFEYPKQPETKSKDLIQYLRNVGASLPTNEKFTLILENNRHRLPDEKSFHKEFNIPTNIKVFWYYRKLKHETRL